MTSNATNATKRIDVEVTFKDDGHPHSAAAFGTIAAPAPRVWAVIADVDRYAERVPMIRRVTRTPDDRVTVDLRFKIALFSVGFQFVAEATMEQEKWLLLRGVSGEPRGIRLRFELTPAGDDACHLRCDGEFDAQSLGFLAKYFLKHHPEIEYGIFPGVVLALFDSMQKAAVA